jgi:error-prone DNA polymerase
MICAADTVGVFQIESRAQMAMLPRLRPRCFYDLVIEVAIVRPGPIQGGMVHPYLKRRRQLEPVTYPSEALRQALGRTLGVPIFQEQVMQVAMLAAGFTAGEADQLRRSMAAWKRKGGVHHFYDRIVSGMVERGYTEEFAQRIFSQIEGFGEYGFPESHAASFALLVYASCWLKRHEPACFLTAMLNAQPLGFYTPSQLVQDACRHGVQVRPIDVSYSDWDCTLEFSDESDAPTACQSSSTRGEQEPRDAAPTAQSFALQAQPAVRLGLRMVKGLSETAAKRLVMARAQLQGQAQVHARGRSASSAALDFTLALGSAVEPSTGDIAGRMASQPAHRISWRSVEDMAESAGLVARDLSSLAAADALASLAGHRREQVWRARAWHTTSPLLAGAFATEELLRLPEANEAEAIVLDHRHTGLSLRRHPLALMRPRLEAQRWLRAADLQALSDGTRVRTCGLVTMRQQPVTAKGVVFVTLEDESGNTNVIVWKALRERQRQELLHAHLLGVQGRWQRDEDTGGQVRHLVAQRLYDLTPWLSTEQS